MRSEEEKGEIALRREEQKQGELRELQMKLNKQIKEKKDRPEPMVALNWQKDVGPYNEQTTSDLLPSKDRFTKPLNESNYSKISFLSRVMVPEELIEKFLLSAASITAENVDMRNIGRKVG